MKKAVKFLKIIVLVILIMLPLCLISINNELIIGDEIWNFQNIMKIINGGKIYVDNNVIITPIFYFLGIPLIKVLGSNILGFRVYNVIIFCILILSSFYIFKLLKIDNLKSILYAFLIFLFVMPYISVGANYNVLAVSFYLMRYNFIFK